MNSVWLVALGLAGVIYLVFRGTASACDVFCNTGQPDSCGKYLLSDGATKIAWAMAGFETGARENFNPYDSSLWQGAAKENNNPGNLRALSGEFQMYCSPAAGFAAMINDIEHKIMGFTVTGLTPSSTLAQLIAVYAPQSDGNPVPAYIQYVSAQTGIDPNAPFNSYIEVSL